MFIELQLMTANVREQLKRAADQVDDTGATLDAWANAVEAGVMRLFVIDEHAAMLTQTARVLNRPTLWVVAVAGDRFEEWDDELDAQLTKLAREANCSHVVAMGRPGWARRMRNYGFDSVQTLIEKEI